MAVMLPTGSSEGAAIVRAIVSAARQKKAPKTMEKAKTTRLLLPNIKRVMWGMMSPMKPITPQQATVEAIIMDDEISITHVVNCVFTPDVCAVSVPNCIIFKFLAFRNKINPPIRKTKVRLITSIQVAEAKLPIVQKMISSKDSWFSTINMVMRAEMRKLSVIPANRMVSTVLRFPV